MINENQQLAERIGELLAESPINEAIKHVILENLDSLPPHLVVRLLDSLEKESEEIERVTFDIQAFIKEQDTDWQNLELEQKNSADQFINRAFTELEDEAQLEAEDSP